MQGNTCQPIRIVSKNQLDALAFEFGSLLLHVLDMATSPLWEPPLEGAHWRAVWRCATAIGLQSWMINSLHGLIRRVDARDAARPATTEPYTAAGPSQPGSQALRDDSSGSCMAETACAAGVADPTRPEASDGAAPRPRLQRKQLLALLLQHTGEDLAPLKCSAEKLLKRLPANIRDELLISHELGEASKSKRRERVERSLQLLAERCYEDALPELLKLQHADFQLEPCTECTAKEVWTKKRTENDVAKICRDSLMHTALGRGNFVASRSVRPILKAHFSKLRPNSRCKFGPTFVRNFKAVVLERGGMFEGADGQPSAKYWFAS